MGAISVASGLGRDDRSDRPEDSSNRSGSSGIAVPMTGIGRRGAERRERDGGRSDGGNGAASEREHCTLQSGITSLRGLSTLGDGKCSGGEAAQRIMFL
jgi:hypothetical protein